VPSAAVIAYLVSYHLGICTVGKLPLGKISWGSYHLGKYPWEVTTLENTFGKLPLGKIPLGSYHWGNPWEVATWEKSFRKLPNTIFSPFGYNDGLEYIVG